MFTLWVIKLDKIESSMMIVSSAWSDEYLKYVAGPNFKEDFLDLVKDLKGSFLYIQTSNNFITKDEYKNELLKNMGRECRTIFENFKFSKLATENWRNCYTI